MWSDLMRRLNQIVSWSRLTGSVLQPFSDSLRVQARREIALRLLQGHAQSISFARDGIRWSLPTQGAVTQDLFLGREHQGENFEPLMRWLDANSARWTEARLIINVGANIGDTAISLHRRTGRPIIACEPVTSTFGYLQQNVATNRFQSEITCRHIAVAPTAGKVQMIVHDDPGMSEVKGPERQGFGPPKGQTVEDVECQPLDSLAEPDTVALVWSDTQGFEASVIESGRALWRAGVPLWVEVWPPGLEAHGGISKFVDVCKAHFTGFIPAGRFAAGPQPVARLPDFISTLQKSGNFSDVLLF
jgi:FkbM family methyltransferase